MLTTQTSSAHSVRHQHRAQGGSLFSSAPQKPRRKQSTYLKPTAAEQLLWEWVKRYCDPVDYLVTMRSPLTGEREDVEQAQNEQLELHLNRRQRLQPITRGLVIRHCRGLPLGLQLHVRPRCPWFVFRLDFDGHNGERDFERAAHHVNEIFFQGRLYLEPTREGYAGWGVAKLPEWVDERTGEVRQHGRAWASARIREMEASLRTELAKEGLDVTFEIQGHFTTLTPMEVTDPDTGEVTIQDRKVICRSRPGCAPSPKTEAEAQWLLDAVFEWKDMQRVIWSHPTGLDAHLVNATKAPAVGVNTPSPTAAVPANIRREAPRPRPRRRQSGIIERSGEKIIDRAKCVSEAIRRVLGRDYDPADVTPEQIDEIVEVANSIYEANGLNDGERDRKRDIDFWKLARKFIANHGPAAGSGLWHGDEDEAIARRLVHRRIGPVRRRKAMASKKGKVRGKLTDEVLGLALVTMAKLMHVASGRPYSPKSQVPVNAVFGMLRHRGITANWTLASLAVNLLIDRGLIWPTTIAGQGNARCWALQPKLYDLLPFLRHLKPAAMPRGNADTDESKTSSATIHAPAARQPERSRIAVGTQRCFANGSCTSHPYAVVEGWVSEGQTIIGVVIRAEKLRRAA